jgi:hypothetical protein
MHDSLTRLSSEPTLVLSSSSVLASSLLSTTQMDGMQATCLSYDDKKQPIHEMFAASSKPITSFPRRDEVAAVHDHDPATTGRNSPWFLTWSTLIFVSIILGIIFAPLYSIPSWSNTFLMPCSVNLSNATKDWITSSRPPSPAFSSNGRTDQVQWDRYTLVLRGQRVLI